MHLNVTIKNVSWPHFSWATLYVGLLIHCSRLLSFSSFSVKTSHDVPVRLLYTQESRLVPRIWVSIPKGHIDTRIKNKNCHIGSVVVQYIRLIASVYAVYRQQSVCIVRVIYRCLSLHLEWRLLMPNSRKPFKMILQRPKKAY